MFSARPWSLPRQLGFATLTVIGLFAGCSGSNEGVPGGTGGVGTGGTGGTGGVPNNVLGTGLFGTVQDGSGRPIERATIEVAGGRATTNNNGAFVIATNVTGDAIAKFQANGYLPTVRRVTIVDGSPTAAHVILKHRAAAQQLMADAGGTIEGARNAAVTIEPGDLSSSKQTSATGMVDVYVTPVDPSDGDEIQALTASFDDGVDLLESFGMVDVTIMQGANELDVAEGETLEIRIPAPTDATGGDLPDSMPLWSLDEETGRWVEEGTLTLNRTNDTYVGEVEHLSAWNADVRATATCMTGIAIDQAGDPVPGAAINTTGVDYRGSSVATTGDDGRFYVAVRKDSRVLVSVVHAAGGGEAREEDSTGEDTTLPPTPGDSRCLDIGTFTIEREMPPPPPPCDPLACEDTGNECTTGQCDMETSNCDVSNVSDGTECEGGVGRCSAGQCVDLCEGVECPSENDCVQDGACDRDSGVCTDGDGEPLDTPCGDGFVCNGSGECVACNDPSQCDDDVANDCNTASCDGNQCGLVSIMDGTACDYVGGPGMCASGVCVPAVQCTTDGNCNDDEVCTIDTCPDGMCMYSPNLGAPCDIQPGLPGVCDAAGNCVDCNVDADCPQGVCESNACVECRSDSDCAEGQICSNQMCMGQNNCGETYSEDFESLGPWFASNGVWEIGEATSGPEGCFEGSGCAATVLDGNYPRGRVSRLTSGIINLPCAFDGEELHLRFWNWFSFGSYNGSTTAEVQIAVRQPDGTDGPWVKVGSAVAGRSAVWSIKDVELTDYAGETVRIGFLINREGSSGPGWYIDNVEILAKAPQFTTDFEDGWVDWSASTGVWEVGEATAGPESCFDGSGCAATVLDGDYPRGRTSRLVSATTALPALDTDEELHLRFWNWFRFGSYNGSTTAQVQVSARQPDGTFGAWVNVGSAVSGNSAVWSNKHVELTNYAGETVRIGFFINREGSSGAGWYIDNIEILAKVPEFTAGFEDGWVDWSATNGVWEIGEVPPDTLGPDGCVAGSSCAATVLGDAFPRGQISRLVSATTTLPSVAPGGELRLQFQNWFSFGTYPRPTTAEVQISVRQLDGTFGPWTQVGSSVFGTSGGWELRTVFLNEYASETVRLGFTMNREGTSGLGWYIDEIQFVTF
ncbi:MAG: choice-of-anchor J domain-containing protein [Myxococcota bacterium]